MDEDLGIWNFIHGTGAGCASIASWEGLRMVMSGFALLGVYLAVTFLIFHAAHKHRKHLQNKLTPRISHRDAQRGRIRYRAAHNHNHSHRRTE